MNRLVAIIALLVAGVAGAAYAADIVAARNIMAGDILTPGDMLDPEGEAVLDGPFIGLEARRAVYKGQAIHEAYLRAPVLVKRNSIVHMEYRRGALLIRTEGRALEEGGQNELVRVMNLGSRQTVTARVAGADYVKVGL